MPTAQQSKERFLKMNSEYVTTDKVKLDPWSFKVVFDPQKAKQHGYSIETLYETLAKSLLKFELERQAKDTWRVKEGADELQAQCVPLTVFAETPWVMDNVEAIYYREDEPDVIIM